MNHFVYIIECKDKYLYTGITYNIEKRLREHKSGLSIITKNRLPIRLVYLERFNNKIDAAKREKEIKGWKRSKKENLIDNYLKQYVYPERE